VGSPLQWVQQSIPLWMFNVVLFSLLFSPLIFNPFPSIEKAKKELEDFFDWLDPKNTAFSDYWYHKEKQDFHFETLQTRPWSGIILKSASLIFWASILVSSLTSGLGEWIHLFATSWCFYTVMAILFPVNNPSSSRENEQTNRKKNAKRVNNLFCDHIRLLHLIATALAVGVKIGISANAIGFAATLWRIVASFFLLLSCLKNVRFILLQLFTLITNTPSRKKTKERGEINKQYYHLLSIITLFYSMRWLEALWWSVFSTVLTIFWSPVSSLFIFNHQVWKTQLQQQQADGNWILTWLKENRL
jgi:hypothetical protein